MAVATPDTYAGTLGQTIYAGVPAPVEPPPPAADSLGEVTVFSTDSGVPFETPDQSFSLELHASGGSVITSGRQYRAAVSGRLEYAGFDEWAFSTLRGAASLGRNVTLMRPTDAFAKYPSNLWREGYWMGFTGMDQPEMRLIVERRLDALMAWVNENLPNVSATRRSIAGGSMGAWGALTYGCRRAHMFAALYPNRPRWRWAGYDAQTANVPNWATGTNARTLATSPSLSADDGGGLVVDHMNVIDYAANTSNTMPWVGWCIGRSDGFSDFRDHIDAVAALRAAKRGFAFVWNDGNHSSGSIIGQITQSYPCGTFEVGKGYPLFTNHSGDQNPSVDLVGGINRGLSFRNVVESASGWSCEVTSILGARTVDVEPISSFFTATVTPQTVTIPAANTWVAVSFTI